MIRMGGAFHFLSLGQQGLRGKHSKRMYLIDLPLAGTSLLNWLAGPTEAPYQ